MAKKINRPVFKSEKEEAEWWPRQEDRIADAFEKAEAAGTLRRGTVARRMSAIPPTRIRLDPADIARARKQAEQRGLKYQTYVKMLLHEALQKRERPAKFPLYCDPRSRTDCGLRTKPETVPQGLKPHRVLSVYGTSKLVP